LKKMGAVQIKTSTYLLPDGPVQYEQFQWLAQQIRDYGGDSTLVRAQEIEGLTKEKVIAMFNDARAKDYTELRKSLQGFIGRRKKMDAEMTAPELERLTRQFREIREVDFFDSARGHDVAMLLRRAEGAAELAPKLGDRMRQKLDLTLGALLCGLQLRREAVAKSDAAVAGGPPEHKREPDQGADRSEQSEQRGRIHGSGLSTSEVVSTSVRREFPSARARWIRASPNAADPPVG